MNFDDSRPTKCALDCQTSAIGNLSEDCVSDSRPVRQVMENGVRHDRLSNDERGQNVKIDSVDTPIDNHVADHTEKNQQVHTGIKKLVGEQPPRKAPTPRAGKRNVD